MSYLTNRKHTRFNFSDIPCYFVLEWQQPAKANLPYRVECKNVSLSGLKFITNHKIPLFTELQMAFLEKKSGTLLGKIRGKVIRLEEVDTGTTEKTFGVAVEFLPSQVNPLAAHINAQTTPDQTDNF